MLFHTSILLEVAFQKRIFIWQSFASELLVAQENNNRNTSFIF